MDLERAMQESAALTRVGREKQSSAIGRIWRWVSAAVVRNVLPWVTNRQSLMVLGVLMAVQGLCLLFAGDMLRSESFAAVLHAVTSEMRGLLGVGLAMLAITYGVRIIVRGR